MFNVNLKGGRTRFGTFCIGIVQVAVLTIEAYRKLESVDRIIHTLGLLHPDHFLYTLNPRLSLCTPTAQPSHNLPSSICPGTDGHQVHSLLVPRPIYIMVRPAPEQDAVL